MIWDLVVAEKRLNDLLDRVSREGHQRIRRGDEIFVVLSEGTGEGNRSERLSFTEFLLSIPRTDELEPMPRAPQVGRPLDG